MKEVIAVIRPEKWSATREAASALGLPLLCHHRVLGRGRQRGLRYLRPLVRGEEVGIAYLPKRLTSWLVPEGQVSKLVAAIMSINRSGNPGDGKIFICPVETAASMDEEPEEQPALAEKEAALRS